MNIDIKAGSAHAPLNGSTPSGQEGGPQNDRCVGLEADLNEMRDRWMRSEAETANVRNRARRDVEDARQYAIQTFAAGVVEAAENLQRGVASLPPPSDREPEIVTRLRDGFSGIERSFVGLLERNGVVRHDPAGAAFDPALHQAMDQQVSTEHPAGTVLQAWTSAWTLNGRLLRPAMVVVSTDAPTNTSSPRAGR